MNKKFCPVPWSYLALKNNGDFRVCCHANTSNEKGLLRKEDDSKFNIAEDTIQDARQSQLMNEVRLSMLNNVDHATCIRCDKEDQAGLNSRRQYEKVRAEKVLTLEKAIEVTNSDGSIDLKRMPIRFMDLRFGNRCNLKCRMCGPTDSELWYDDHVNLWGEASFNEGGEQVNLIKNIKGKWTADTKKYHWIDEEHSWDQLKSNLSEVEYIYIVGGEPLLVTGHVEILKECIERGQASKMTLEYNTNLTLLPENVLELWKQFKVVRIGISIDGVKDVNDYIRSPSKWEQIEFNINKLLSFKADHNFEVWFSLTYQAYNAYHLVTVLEWIKNEFVLSERAGLKGISLKTHPLHRPEHLSVKILPVVNKQELAQIYLDYIEQLKLENNQNKKLDKFIKVTEKMLHSLIVFMNTEDLSIHLDTFLRFTKELDEMRSERIQNVIPEIGKLIYG